MKPKAATEIKKDGKNVITEVKPDLEYIGSLLKSQSKSRVLFVILVGPYQVGKSSTIAALTGIKGIPIGDGINEETSGVNIYGPISFNVIRSRFDCFEDPNDDTIIYFFDTEGNCGFQTGSSSEETTFLLSQIFAPYAALSNVIVTISQSNLSKGVPGEMEKMLEIFETIHNSGNQKNSNVINVINDAFIGEKGYEKEKEEALETFEGRSKMFKDHDFVILPKYNRSQKWEAQSKFFKKGFEFFAKQLINKLQDCLRSNGAFTNGEEAFNVFKKLVNITKGQDLGKLAEEAKRNALKSTFETLFKPVIDKIVNQKLEELDKKQDEINKQKEIFKVHKIEQEDIINAVINKIKEQTPEYIQNSSKDEFENSIEEAKRMICEKIEKIKQDNCNKVQSNIKSKANNQFNEIISKYHQQIAIYKGKSLSEIAPYNMKEKIEEEIKGYISNLFHESGISKDNQSNIEEEIQQNIEKEIQQIYLEALNHISQQIIKQSIEAFENEFKYKLENNEKIDINGFIDNIINNDIQRNLPFQINEKDEIKALVNQIQENIKVKIQNKVKMSSIKFEINKKYEKEAKQIDDFMVKENQLIDFNDILSKEKIQKFKNYFSKYHNDLNENDIKDLINIKIELLRNKAMKKKQEYDTVYYKKMMDNFEKRLNEQFQIYENMLKEFQEREKNQKKELETLEENYNNKLKEIKEQEKRDELKKNYNMRIQQLKKIQKDELNRLSEQLNTQKTSFDEGFSIKNIIFQSALTIGIPAGIKEFVEHGIPWLIKFAAAHI